MPGERPWAVALSAVLAAAAYAAWVTYLVHVHPVWSPVALVLALVVAGVAASKGWVARRPRVAVATLAGALWLAPFARLAFWNASSPLYAAAGDWHRWLNRAIHPWTGGYHAHEALPAHLYVPYLALALAPAALLGLALVLTPVAGGWALSTGAARALADRPPRVTGAALVVALVVGVTAFPVACDMHESWEEVPNATCSCVGAEFEYYPPGISDGASIDYCIGIERSLD